MESQPIPLTGGKRFILDWLGLAILLFFLLNSLAAGALVPMFSSPQNSQNILMQSAPYIALALATALVSVPHGYIDLSPVGMLPFASMIIALSAMEGSVGVGVVTALIVCGLFGALSGFLCVCLKAPSYLVTLLVGGILRGVAFLGSNGAPIHGFAMERLSGPGVPMILILFSGAIAVGLFFLVKKMSPKAKPIGILAFVGSALIVVLVGFFFTMRLQAAQPTLGSGYETSLVFIWAALATSRLLGRTPLAFAAAILPGWYQALASNVLTLLNVNVWFQQTFFTLLALIFIGLAFFFHHLRKRWLGEQPPLLS